MKIDLPRARATPVPETLLSLILLFILLSCSLLARFVLLIYLSVGSRAHSDFSSPSGDTPLYHTTSILCICVCMLIDFFFPFLYSSLVKQATTKERTNERTNDGAERKEKERREKLNYNHSATIYIYIY
jgi:hypothetical protein